MGIKVFGFVCLLPMVAATMVEMESVWKENFGWQITCSWKLYSNDSLQSVRLYNNVQQFMIYRPENEGTQRTRIFSLPDNVLEVNCEEAVGKGNIGKCVINLELYQPQREDFTYACEVSGERPYFRMEKTEIVVPALIPPSGAVIEVVEEHSTGRATLNCSSSGVPAPSLIWTIGDQREPQTFSASYWNVTSKLWNVWSLLIYTPSQTHYSRVVCTPEVSKSNKTYKGLATEYNSANSIEITAALLGVLNLLILLT